MLMFSISAFFSCNFGGCGGGGGPSSIGSVVRAASWQVSASSWLTLATPWRVSSRCTLTTWPPPVSRLRVTRCRASSLSLSSASLSSLRLSSSKSEVGSSRELGCCWGWGSPGSGAEKWRNVEQQQPILYTSTRHHHY